MEVTCSVEKNVQTIFNIIAVCAVIAVVDVCLKLHVYVRALAFQVFEHSTQFTNT